MSSNNKSSLAGSDWIHQHPPEREARNVKHVFLFVGCSCCCCCFHTVGGLIGAAVVGNYRAKPEVSADMPIPSKDLPSSQGLYWNSFLVTIIAGALIGGAFNFERIPDAFIIMILFGPLWLLGASVIAVLQIVIRIPRSLRSGYWRHLGTITLGMLAGSILGVLVMWLYSLS